MAVTFVFGRAGVGKTHYCLDSIGTALADPADTRRLVLLVPEQASFQMERALALRSPRGGFSRAEVLSFSRLAQRVLADAGHALEIVGPAARALALRHVVANADDALRTLRGASRTAGFYTQLASLIDELLREHLHPDDLRRAAAQVTDRAARARITDVARVYADYLASLGTLRTDAAARLDALRTCLPGVTWLDDCAIWVDGFAGFTGQELHTLVALASRVRTLTITLLLDPASPAVQPSLPPVNPLSLFQRSETTYQSLVRLLADAGVEVGAPVRLQPAIPPRFDQAPHLHTLEVALATPFGAGSPRPAGGAEPPRLLECNTHRDELRAAARWIRAEMAAANGALRFRDFAVIARDLEPLAETVAEVFDEYGLPYFLDRRRPLRASPLTRLLLVLLEVVRGDFAPEAVVQLLRTQLLPLSRTETERLENLVVREQVRGQHGWQRARWGLEAAHFADERIDLARSRLITALTPLLDAVSEQRGAGLSGIRWAELIHDTLDRLAVPMRLTEWISSARARGDWEAAEKHRLSWEGALGVLEDLHAVLGDTRLTLDELLGTLRAALDELTLALAPPTLDQVLVGSIERSRHPDVKFAWVLAFNEGIFPARPGDDVILSTAQREALRVAGLPGPGAHRDEVYGERMLAYIAFTRPGQELVISYATVSENGEELLPSPLLSELRHVWPALAVERTTDREEVPTTTAETARSYLAAAEDDAAINTRIRHERLRAELQQDPALAPVFAWLLRGRSYANAPDPVGHYRKPTHAPAQVVWDTSASELETYLQCPFKHFAQYGLRLDPARGPLPLRWDLGTQAHELMAAVTARAMRSQRPVDTLSDDDWLGWLDQVVDAWRATQPTDLLERQPERATMSALLLARLPDLVLAHAARWRRGGFAPQACEQYFHPDKADAPLAGGTIDISPQERVHLHGIIDRIDAAEDHGRTLLLVYDYKSSGAGDPLDTTFLTGARLQLALYLVAAGQAYAAAPGATPAGGLLAPLYPQLEVLNRKYAQQASPEALQMLLFRPRGLLIESAARLLDRQLSNMASPVAQMELTKDGAFHRGRSDVAAAGELERVLELARRTVKHATQSIVAGHIDVAPLVEKQTLACRHCNFHAVCRIDRAFNAPRLAARALPRLEDIPAGGSAS